MIDPTIFFEKYTPEQDAERYTMLGLDPKDKTVTNDTYRFENVTVETLKQLVEKGYLALNDAQNLAPSARKYIAFMEKYPKFLAHGYIVSNDRGDRRITIEGLQSEAGDFTDEEVSKFLKLERKADECSIDTTLGLAWSWWD